jgi:XTP/dITP diphosphohydrolase
LNYIVFATNNPHKLAEIQAMLGDEYTLLDLNAIGCLEDIPENEPTLAGNALAKARYLNTHFGHDCFADDTGLEVDALHGAPGVFSARYAGKAKDAHANMDLLLKNLGETPMRTARFKTVIALLKDGHEYLFEGVIEGHIITEKRGTQGFGYDPIFVPLGETRTFAQMDMLEKATMSHRGRAVKKLVDFLRKEQA